MSDSRALSRSMRDHIVQYTNSDNDALYKYCNIQFPDILQLAKENQRGTCASVHPDQITCQK